MRKDWRALEPEFTGLVLVGGLTDNEIAAHYEVTITTIRSVRRQIGLPLNRKKRSFLRHLIVQLELPYTTYIENGHTIKVYPPCYAFGAIDTCTARPRR